MNISNNRELRCLVLSLLIALGVATTLATGGGGGGGGGGGDDGDDGGNGGTTGPTLPITVDNGQSVAATVITAIGLSFDIGELGSGDLLPQAGGRAPTLLSLTGIDELLGKLPGSPVTKVENCLVSGTVDVTAQLADPNTLTVGDQITALFDNCDDNEGFVIDGRLDLTVAAVDGDILTPVFRLGLDVVMTDIMITEGTEVSTANGDVTVTLDSLAFPVIGLGLDGSRLELGSAGDVITLTNFTHTLESDTGVTPDTKLAEVLGRLGSQLLGGSVAYETVVPVRAIGDFDPHAGQILLTGAGDSTVLIDILDGSRITLEIDENGDGVVDEFVDTTWAELTGQTSTVNSSTAPVIAKESIAAVAGFASLTVTAGAQFAPAGPWGQIEQQALVGDFGPVDILCAASGTATVSGFIASAGTYSADDRLDTTFANCARVGESLSGEMVMTVTGFEETPNDAYAVSGSVVETALERAAGGLLFTGTGSFVTSYDFVFTSAGVILMNASANTFTVAAGGVDRSLSSAIVNAEILAGPAPVQITRSSSGRLTSPLLTGSYDYESVAADVFFFDVDPATGPFSGELLVTAGDSSALRIVALDELNVRLDVDTDGDGIAETSIATTWADLQ